MGHVAWNKPDLILIWFDWLIDWLIDQYHKNVCTVIQGRGTGGNSSSIRDSDTRDRCLARPGVRPLQTGGTESRTVSRRRHVRHPLELLHSARRWVLSLHCLKYVQLYSPERQRTQQHKRTNNKQQLLESIHIGSLCAHELRNTVIYLH